MNKRDILVDKTIDAYHQATGSLPDVQKVEELQEIVDDYLKEEK